MKKIVLCLIIMLCLTGCSIEYNIEITKDDFNESTTIMTDTRMTETYQNESLENILSKISNNYYEPIYFNDENYDYYVGGKQDNVVFYDISPFQKDYFLGVNLKHNFKYNDIYRSNIIKNCFNELSIQNSDNYILLRTDNNCKAFREYSLLENITINIKTSLEVIASNADKVENGIYTWVITRENYGNKSVHLTYNLGNNNIIDNPIDNDKEEENKPDEKPQESEERIVNNKMNSLIIMISFGILIMVLTIVIKRKKTRL